jgi:hypothetical protein
LISPKEYLRCLQRQKERWLATEFRGQTIKLQRRRSGDERLALPQESPVCFT